ncbi:hypothetical protein FH972_025268 [Carpinus fangiana]|uniref:FLZ-type domain-containing protein n=1 Tax=Carpinus fangiana TaxID=176857 RepID=A0A5N6L344_9ROSI|nr:hypothetical protein FH972_025268 [Carpinus fangiana]
MGENGMKRLMAMIMLLVRLFLVLKHAEDSLLPFSATRMPPSLHPLPLPPPRLLSFSQDDGVLRHMKKIPIKERTPLQKCYAYCDEVYLKNLKFLYERCRAMCKRIHGT